MIFIYNFLGITFLIIAISTMFHVASGMTIPLFEIMKWMGAFAYSSALSFHFINKTI